MKEAMQTNYKENKVLESINSFALEQANRYHNLRIGQSFVNTPFFINQIELWYFDLMQKADIPYDQIMKVSKMYKEKQMPFGWYKGKGSPEELEQATTEIAKKFNLDLKRATPESAAEFMKYVGLGIDCSGLVTNCLEYAFDKAGKGGFLNSLDMIPYEDGSRSKYRAGVFSYKDDSASFTVAPNELQPLDILIRGGWHDMAWHMGLVLKKDNEFLLVHSTLGLTPNGVHSSILKIKDNKPVFDFKPNLSPVDWEEYYDNGTMEFRRLRYVVGLDNKLRG